MKAPTLGRNDSVEKGIAAVPFADMGVSPMASTCADNASLGAMSPTFDLVSGRQPVRLTRAIPNHNCIVRLSLLANGKYFGPLSPRT